MAALTQPVNRTGRCEPAYRTNAFYVAASGYVLYKGAFIMAVAGKARPAASGVAGAVLLGVLAEYAADRIDASGGDVTISDGVRPLMGRWEVAISASDPVSNANIGTAVALADDNTIKATIAANDVTVVLRDIINSTTALVEIV